MKDRKHDEPVDYGFSDSPLVLTPLNPDAEANLKAKIGKGAYLTGDGSITVNESLLAELRAEGWVIIKIGTARKT